MNVALEEIVLSRVSNLLAQFIEYEYDDKRWFGAVVICSFPFGSVQNLVQMTVPAGAHLYLFEDQWQIMLKKICDAELLTMETEMPNTFIPLTLFANLLKRNKHEHLKAS